MWVTVHNQRVSYKIQSTIWSQFNKSCLTNLDISANCKYYDQVEAEQQHLLKCPIAEKMWVKFNSLLEKLSDQPLDDEEKIFRHICPYEVKSVSQKLHNFCGFKKNFHSKDILGKIEDNFSLINIYTTYSHIINQNYQNTFLSKEESFITFDSLEYIKISATNPKFSKTVYILISTSLKKSRNEHKIPNFKSNSSILIPEYEPRTHTHTYAPIFKHHHFMKLL